MMSVKSICLFLLIAAVAEPKDMEMSPNITVKSVRNPTTNETDAVLEFPDFSTIKGVPEVIPINIENKNNSSKSPTNNGNGSLLEFPKQIGGKVNKVETTQLPETRKDVNFAQSSEIGKTEEEEIKDLLTLPEIHQSIYNESESVPDTIQSTSINTEVEQIENGDNTEENRIKHHIENLYETNSQETSAFGGQLAAILAGLFAVTSIVAYLGLLYWRRYLENRYGSRTMLVDDDFFDPEGIKNFSI